MEENKIEAGSDRPAKNKKRQKLLIVILSVVTAAAIGVTVWALFFRDAAPVLAPDYAPQQIEKNAESIDDGGDDKLSQPEGGGAVNLTYSNEVRISLSSKEAALLFQNPSKSNQDMKVEIAIDGKTIVSSGRLEPGYQVERLSNTDTEKLLQGVYEGKFIVSYYDADSGEKAVVNTEIPVRITVEN